MYGLNFWYKVDHKSPGQIPPDHEQPGLTPKTVNHLTQPSDHEPPDAPG